MAKLLVGPLDVRARGGCGVPPRAVGGSVSARAANTAHSPNIDDFFGTQGRLSQSASEPQMPTQDRLL